MEYKNVIYLNFKLTKMKADFSKNANIALDEYG